MFKSGSFDDGRAYTEPDDLYEYTELEADQRCGVEDEGTLPELIQRHVILQSLFGDDTSILYEPVILTLVIGLTKFTLKPKGWR